MNPLFQTVSGIRPHKSRFDGGHDLIFSNRFGKLTPCFCEPVVPGDIFDERAEVFSRFLPLLAPLMHRNNIFIHYFFVPNRLIWSDWEDFVTGGEDGTLNPVWPRMVIESHEDYTDWRSLMTYYAMFHTSSLADYFGFPVIKKSIANYIRYSLAKDTSPDKIASDIFYSIADESDIEYSDFAISYAEFLDDPYFLTTFFSFGHSNLAYGQYATPDEFGDFYDEFLTKNNIKPGSCEIVVDLLPFRAYLKTYNDFYRDQNLEEEIEFSIDSGIFYVDFSEGLSPEYDLFETRLRAWEKDYFTSALPFAQRGPEIKIPLGGEDEVNATLNGILSSDNSYNQLGVVMVDQNGETCIVRRTNTNGQFTDADGNLIPYNSDGTQSINVVDVEGSDYPSFVHSGRLKLDLSGVTSATINDLRKAFQVQKWEERTARGGGRYPEQILSHFGVVCPDFRLQRPEYLGGGLTPISVNMVTQTSEDNTTPLGTMAGQALAVGRSNKFRKFFVEHGYVIGLLSVMPRSNYHTGLPAKYNRFDRFEHYFPEFAHIGEQPIRNSEIFYSGMKERDEEEFGYQGVYMSYKWFQSRIAGDMRDTLKYWNMSRSFTLDNLPVLNNDFIKVNPDLLSDIFAIDLSDKVFVDYKLPWWQRQIPQDEIIIQMYHNLKAYRPMPFNSEPGWIDHF